MSAVLSRNLPTLVEFDPENQEHRDVFLTLILNGKQHPTTRFFLREPFGSVVSMMLHILAFKACTEQLAARGLTLDSAIHSSVQEWVTHTKRA